MAVPALMPVYPRCDVAPVRGEGCYLFDADGRKWLDFAAGIAVNALGHGHPHLVGAIAQQAATLMHVSNLYGSPQQMAAAQRLVDLTFADTVFFTNSGAEAVECAIKTARAYQNAVGHPEKYRILTFANAFHGRTMTTIAMTDQDKLRHGFEPLPDWAVTIPFNDIAAAEAAIDESIGTILVEPVQGEGGVRPATAEFMATLRALADRHDLMLVLDEVQTGVGRTGTFLAHEQYGMTPDIAAIAKGIGGGFPVGACLATEKAAQGMVFGSHGSTYGGNPLAMAAVGAVLDIVAEPEFLAGVRQKGARLRQAIEQMIPNHALFDSVRGLGLMLGLKLNVDARGFVAHARSYGLLAVPAGDNVMRIVPPLIIEDAHISEFVSRLSAAAAAFDAGPAA
jgi:acetylornithine/N-succinyldiaminopimelate aminotransferase